MLELRFKVASERPVDSGGFEEEGRKEEEEVEGGLESPRAATLFRRGEPNRANVRHSDLSTGSFVGS